MLSVASTEDGTWIQQAQDQSWSASSLKPNIRFVGSPIVLHWKGRRSSIWSAIEVNEHLMERIFDKLSSRSGPTLRSHWQGLQIIMIICYYFCWVLRRSLCLSCKFGTLAQVGACPKYLVSTLNMYKDVLHLGRLLRRPARKSSWRPNPCQVCAHLEIQEQLAVKRTPRTHTDSVFNDPPMDGKIIL
jgi:hypothetical protein